MHFKEGKAMSTFIIGDIHGCYDELDALLDKAALSANDTIIALGDLVNRGPKPAQVMRWLSETPNARSIKGNHEHYHIEATKKGAPPGNATLLTRWDLNHDYDAAITVFEALPLYIELDEALLVHGFYEPGVPIQAQKSGMLLGLDEAESELKARFDRPWYELYDGDKPIIVGHRDYTDEQKPFIMEGRVYGLDTRCVYGGSLTGLLLPEWRLVSVPVRSDHWADLKQRHGF
jgi:serine/threonine protein phosphatase 1